MQAYPNNDKIIDVKQKTHQEQEQRSVVVHPLYYQHNSPTLSRDYNMFLCMSLQGPSLPLNLDCGLLSKTVVDLKKNPCILKLSHYIFALHPSNKIKMGIATIQVMQNILTKLWLDQFSRLCLIEGQTHTETSLFYKSTQ